MKYLIRETKCYKKAFKRLSRSGRFDVKKLNKIINTLAAGKELSLQFLDHRLSAELKDYCECHIGPDLLLIYKIDKENQKLILVNLGSHPELFG